MTVEFPISTGEADYVARRKQLRKQRRLRIFQRIWQLTFITGLTGAMLCSYAPRVAVAWC